MSVLHTLSKRDLAFVAAYAKLGTESDRPCDKELAALLGCTRRTVINRRKRLRSKGVPLFPYRARGFDDSNRPVTIDQIQRRAERLRSEAAERLKRAERLDDQAREMTAAITMLG